jgi:hypothetical protein
MQPETSRKLAAIMFTDIFGFTALMENDEADAMEKKRHDFWNRKKMGNSQTYVPEMEPFSLSKEQRNSIITYNKVYSVQFQAVLGNMNYLLKSNEALIKLLDKELDK